LLTITTVLSVLLFTFHVADDIGRGFEEGRVWNLSAVLIFVVWLSGALLLPGRRLGYAHTLLGSLLGLAAPTLHMSGKGVGEIAKSSGGFFFVWTLLALGVTALLSVILSVHGLWRQRRGQSR
jgi:hypothetical protein